MSDSTVRTQSMDFAVQIVNLVKSLKEKREEFDESHITKNGQGKRCQNETII